MNAQLITKTGMIIDLSDQQYETIVELLHLVDDDEPLTEEEANAILDELEGITANDGFTTDDLLAERRKERELEKKREERYL